MAKFCTMCGSPLADPAHTWCDACQAAQEQTASIEPDIEAYFESRTRQPANAVQPFLELAQEAFLKPSIAIQRASGFANAIPGLVMAVVGSIIAALTAVLFIRKILNDIFGGLFGDFGGASWGGVPIHFGSAFFKILLLLLLQWVVLSLVLTGAARLFKQRVTAIQSLNIVGVTKLYIAAGAVAAFILHYILPALSVAILLAVFIAGYLAIEKGIRPLLRPRGDTFYLVPSAVGLYGVCVWLLFKIFS